MMPHLLMWPSRIDRANLRIQYIVSILHGDIPEEIYTDEDTDESADTEDSGETEEILTEE